MKTRLCLAVAVASLAAATIDAVSAATLFVSLESTNPVPPYATWATAATNIQHAVDAARARDTVLVTNGVYSVGGRMTTNENGWVNGDRVSITNSIRLESVNGPLMTTIVGSTTATNELGEEVTEWGRCVYLGTNAVLSGFTLTTGRFEQGAGVFCEFAAVVTNCTLTGNWALSSGGGAYGGTLYNCTLTTNSAFMIMKCGGLGGGASGCTLYNCTLTSNSALCSGGGAYQSTLYNCTLTGNSATGCDVGEGGGACGGTLYNCTLTGNSATSGGGACGCTLYNCTLTSNSAEFGGGVSWSRSDDPCILFNSIVYYNSGGNYELWWTELDHCCTTPLPTNGVGNIDADPRFVNAAAGDFRLRPDSPCIDAGMNLTDIITTDILGVPRPLDGNGDGIARCDMGAYEFNPYRFEPTLRVSPDGFEFTVQGEPGKSVRLERSRDLANWEWAATVPIPATGQTLIDPAATAEPFLFYRALSMPFP